MIRLTQGIPRLSLQLEQQVLPAVDISWLKYQIYLNQDLLNQKDVAHKTPLSYCKHPELRKLMIKLGANPAFLDPTVRLKERKQLLADAADAKRKIARLRQLILSAYQAAPNDVDTFSHTLRRSLSKAFKPLQTTDAEMAALTAFAFHQLRFAQNKVDLMDMLERLVNFFNYLFFGTDVLSLTSDSTSRNLMFYENNAENPDAQSSNPSNHTPDRPSDDFTVS